MGYLGVFVATIILFIFIFMWIVLLAFWYGSCTGKKIRTWLGLVK